MLRGVIGMCSVVMLTVVPSAYAAPPKTDAQMIVNAVSAAPKAVGSGASVVAMDKNGQMRTLREGKNGFVCMPDNPSTPGDDPMCTDKNGFAWAHAWMSRQTPPSGQVGLIYMLRGGSDASNTDPHATAPAKGGKWVDTGPHVMIVGATQMMPAYPQEPGDGRSPYVMWPGTPYEHLMVPVK